MTSETVSAIVQARMGSSRLPNKSMLYLHGYPIIHWIFHRVKKTKKINKIVFALPDNHIDDILHKYLEDLGANVHRGSENDLITRFLETAKKHNMKNIVRICADNPLISASEIDRLIEYYFKNETDYCYNHMPINNQYPDGLGAEIFSYDLLQEIDDCAKESKYREHVTNFIWDNKKKYKISTFDPPINLCDPKLKLDLNTYEEYNFLMSKPYNINMDADEVVKTSKTPT